MSPVTAVVYVADETGVPQCGFHTEYMRAAAVTYALNHIAPLYAATRNARTRVRVCKDPIACVCLLRKAAVGKPRQQNQPAHMVSIQA